MPGLKFEEELNWDKRNLTTQLFIVIENIRLLKDYLDNSTNTLDTHLRGILKNLSGRQKNLSVTSPKDIFEFQKDLGALIFLTENSFDFERYIGDTTDLYTVAQEFIRQTGTCKDIAIQFPKMVQDAITAIQTDGHQPPAEEMQKAQDFFNERYRKSMEGTLI